MFSSLANILVFSARMCKLRTDLLRLIVLAIARTASVLAEKLVSSDNACEGCILSIQRRLRFGKRFLFRSCAGPSCSPEDARTDSFSSRWQETLSRFGLRGCKVRIIAPLAVKHIFRLW